jgi:hypothetical protein
MNRLLRILFGSPLIVTMLVLAVLFSITIASVAMSQEVTPTTTTHAATIVQFTGHTLSGNALIT